MDSQERWYRDNIDVRGQVVADVGANVGKLSRFFWEQGRGDCRVVSIEPVAENVEKIRRRIQSAGAGDRWTVEHCAVSDHDGALGLRTFDAGWGRNSVVADDGDRVACKRLVTLVPDATVVKIDIEGHEYSVLPDALATMPNVIAWAVELHGVRGHLLQDTLKSFVDRGYEIFAAGRKRGDPDGPWVNAPIPTSLSWDQIPGTPSAHDGVEGVFRMLHVLALSSRAAA